MMAHPYFLLLIIPLTIIFILRARRKPAAIVLSSLTHFKDTDVRLKRSKRHLIPLTLYYLTGILFAVVLARPQKGVETIERKQEGIDIVLALDVSGSMLEYDPSENTSLEKAAEMINDGLLKNRLEVARKELIKFTEKRPTDRIGIVLFAGKAFSMAPPTKDHDFLKQSLQRNDYKVIQQYTGGTNLAAPIAKTIEHLKNSPAKRRVMVLFTDGANTVNDHYTPEQMAQAAADNNISIYTVGIGSDTPLTINRGFNFFGGSGLVRTESTIDEEMMKNIADKTQGRYLKAKDAQSFNDVMESINRLEKVEIEDPVFVHYKELYHYFLAGALALMLLGMLCENTISLKVP